jgi:hypothetical protein
MELIEEKVILIKKLKEINYIIINKNSLVFAKIQIMIN